MTIEDVNNLSYCNATIEGWCERAKGKPLTLYIYFGFVDPDIGFHTLPSSLLSLAPVISRVRHLGLAAGIIDSLLPYLVDTHWDLDNLESLYLTSFFGEGFLDDEIDVSIPAFDLFNTAPNLRKVTIGNEFLTLVGTLEILPWSSMTSLTLTEPLIGDTWIQIVKICSQLRIGDFIIRDFEDNDLEDFRDHKHVHEHLEDLTFETRHCSVSVFDILSMFDLPALVCLDLRTEDNGDVCVAPISSKAFRNLAEIRSLVVDGGWDSDTSLQVLADFLRECSNLEDLTLSSVSPKFSSPELSPLFTAMSLGPGSPTFLPNLAVLNICFSDDSLVFDTVALSEMISTRLRLDIGNFVCQLLKKVFIYVPRCNRYAGVLERMKTLISLDSVSHQSVTLTDLWGHWSLGRPRESPYYDWNYKVHVK